MLSIALFTLLTTVQAAAPAQPELKGQPCTAEALVGTWQHMGASGSPGATTVLKHVTPTHFFVLRLTDKDVVESGHGGPYTFANGMYTETLAHGLGPRFETGRGATHQFQCRIDGDIWRIAGVSQGLRISEQWKRVSGSSPKG